MQTQTAPGESTHGEEHRVSRALLWVHPEERLDPLPNGATLLGRGDDATIRLSGDRVSRRHATIHVAGSKLVLRDEGSLNKVRCNATPIVEAQLKGNDVVRIGDWVGVIVELVEPVPDTSAPLREIHGAVVGPQSQRLWSTLERVAAQNLPIVIEGESGTGKEVVASALHRMSGRPGSFVPVNCAAQPEGLFEATFFGHVKGSFTGATQSGEGYFVAADTGTLFLDEVIELTAPQQAKILRAVEEGAVVPVGATRSRQVDVRIVCAAQRPLGLLSDEGKFRADLYARLSGLTLKLLPLRDRREEIPRLFKRALSNFGDTAPALSASFVEGLCTHSFRLNVRELVATARRCRALYSDLPELTARHLTTLLDEHAPAADPGREPAVNESVRPSVPSPKAVKDRRSRDLLDQLNQALEECSGNLSEAARKVGMSRHQANRLLQAAKRG